MGKELSLRKKQHQKNRNRFPMSASYHRKLHVFNLFFIHEDSNVIQENSF